MKLPILQFLSDLLHYLPTYLTPWSRIILDMSAVTQ